MSLSETIHINQVETPQITINYRKGPKIQLQIFLKQFQFCDLVNWVLEAIFMNN